MPLLPFQLPSHEVTILESSKVTQWIHYRLGGNRPLDVNALVEALLGQGFIGQLRIHFDGSHARVGRGEVIVKRESSVEPLTNGPPMR